MRQRFIKTLCEEAEKNHRIWLVCGDVGFSVLEVFNRQFPDRFVNVGVAEQNMISIAAGMALEGLRPVVYSITPFLIERPFEQIKIDIDEQDLPVMLIGNADYPTHGPTHRPLNAEGLVALFKNIVGYFPRNREETEKAMIDAYLMKKPAIICLKRDELPFF